MRPTAQTHRPLLGPSRPREDLRDSRARPTVRAEQVGGQERAGWHDDPGIHVRCALGQAATAWERPTPYGGRWKTRRTRRGAARLVRARRVANAILWGSAACVLLR